MKSAKFLAILALAVTGFATQAHANTWYNPNDMQYVDQYPMQHNYEMRQIHTMHTLRHCAPMAEAAVSEEQQIAPPVYFAPASDKLTPTAMVSVKKVAALLKSPGYRGHHVLISGYTDTKGKNAGNQRLSYHRAVVVTHELEMLGVPAAQLTAQGFGEESPAATNATPEGRALNRRVTFTLDDRM